MIDVKEMFPGDGAEIPTKDERDRADELVGFEIPRSRTGSMSYFASPATNRAFVRSQVKRWALRNGR